MHEVVSGCVSVFESCMRLCKRDIKRYEVVLARMNVVWLFYCVEMLYEVVLAHWKVV